MATELATAYLSLVPSMRGAQGAIARDLAGVDADGIGKSIGGRLGGGIASTVKGLVGPALAAAGAVMFGGVIAEAARASDATDKFKQTMNFAGIDTAGIDAATAAAKKYADQTVYDLPTIQATMAQLASNGVKNYKELAEAGGNLNAVAGGNAETFKSVSRTLTQSAGAGKLMTEDWNMLADAIPGASGPLQEAMKKNGAYTGNFKKAMEDGQITSEEFQTALLELGSKPVAVEAAKSVTTFEGAIGNLQATINSGLMGALDTLKPAITGVINGVSTGLGAVFGFFGGLFGGLKSLIMDNDITPQLLNTLGLEEDSPIIGGLWWLKDQIWTVFYDIQTFLSGFSVPFPDLEAQAAGSLSPFLTYGIQVKEMVRSVYFGISDFIAGFTLPKGDIVPDAGGLVEFGSQVRDIFDGLFSALAPLIPSMLDLWSAVSPVQTIFAALLPNVGPLVDVLGLLVLTIGGSLISVIQGVLPAFQSLQAVFVNLFTNVLATVLPVIVQLVTMLGATLAQLIPVLVPIIVQVANLAATLIAQLAPIFMQLVSAVLPMVVSSLGSILAAVIPLVSTLAAVLIPTIQALMPVVVTVFGVIVSLITSAMQIIQGIIQVVTGIISGNWSQVFAGLGNIVSGAFSFIVNLIGGALSVLGGLIGAGLSIVGNLFSMAFNGILSFIGGVWGQLANGASGMVSNLIGMVGSLPGKILGALGDFGGLLVSVGRDMIQGLINGISGMMGAIGRAVINIVPEAIRGPFESLLGIHSPSRVFRAYGINIGEGLVLGLEDMHGAVKSATEGLAYVPGAPAFASPGAVATYGGYGATPADTGPRGPLVEQKVYPAEKMSEENLATIAARKITGALV